MKRILILAYDYPPYNSIGAQRPYAWYRYFRQLGLEPIVVTRHWDVAIRTPNDCYQPSLHRSVTKEVDDLGTVIRAPFDPLLRDRLIGRTGTLATLLRKSLSLFQYFFEFSAIRVFDNKRGLYDAARAYLRDEKVDCIIATGEPFVLLSYASALSKEFGIPWVADYRDGWSTNFNTSSLFQKWLAEHWMRSRERKVTSTASLITTAAPVFSAQIAHLLGLNPSHIPVIYNGYFHEKFQELGVVPLKKKFSIAHAGTLYYFQRVETFLRGLNLLLEKRPEVDMEVTFYGLNFYPEQIARIRAQAGKAQVVFVDKLPHDEMLKELASSHMQLLLATPEKHQIYAKVFDYMASGRPLLMVENDRGPLEEMLSSRSNAAICSSPEEVCEHLEAVWDDPSLLQTVPVEDDTFTRRNQTARLAQLILETIERNERK